MALLARDSICWKFKGIFEKLQNHKTALIKGLSFICIVLLCAFVIHWFLCEYVIAILLLCYSYFTV